MKSYKWYCERLDNATTLKEIGTYAKAANIALKAEIEEWTLF